MDFRVLLYYHFGVIEDPQQFREEHLQLCQSLGLLGRILIAREGINGTVSGTVGATDHYMQALKADPRFKGIEFKIDEAEAHAFKKLFLRVRDEIITLGVPLSAPVHQHTAPHVSPAEWKRMMNEEDVVILDTRNVYESGLGHFKNAICPPLESFRDFPDWIRQHADLFRNKKILTYCTGGIRCEKFTAWMLDEGFEDVFQLHGGIVMYGKDPETQGEGFIGTNVVFDERVNVSAGPKSEPLTLCRECGSVTANYVNCANVVCNRRMILCETCEANTERCCSEECRRAPLRREKGKKLYESPRTIPLS